MNKEDSKYYDDLFETLATPGWKLIAEEAEKQIEAYKEELVTEFDPKVNDFRRGQIAQLRQLANFEHLTREMHKAALEEDALDADV